MLDEKLIRDIKNSYYKGHSYKESKKYKNKDFKFEYVDDPWETSFDKNGKLVKRNFIGDLDCIYDFDSETGQYIKILDSLESFVERRHGEYKNTSFDYIIYNVSGFDVIDIFKIIPNSSILELPDEINGIPVVEATLYREVDNKKIEKIILGNNIVFIRSFTKHLSNLKEVVVKSGYNVDVKSLIEILAQCVNYSSYEVSIDIKYNRDIKLVNNCILSNDENRLFLVCSKNKAIIPDSVEVIESNAFINKFKTSTEIKWPKSLKIIELQNYSFDKLLAQNPLPDTIEVLNEITMTNFIEYNELFGWYDLRIPRNIKRIDSSVVSKLDKIGYINVDPFNENFVYENELLLTKDRKSLIICLYKSKVLYLPETLENIQKYAFIFPNKIKTIVLKRKDDNLIKQLEYIKDYYKYNFKIEILQAEVKDKTISNENKINLIPEFIVNKSRCYITNEVTADILEVDFSNFQETKKKIFVITKECANIKHLIIPEGVTDIVIDSSCYSVKFNLEILELPSSCKFSNILEELDTIDSFMMLIINPIKKPRWLVHELSYVVACKSNFSMPKGVFKDYDSYFGIVTQEYLYINEITYIKNFDKDKLIKTDNAYYYITNKSKKEVGLLKVKNVPEFSIPEKVNNFKVKKFYDYCYEKLSITATVTSENEENNINKINPEIIEKKESKDDFIENKELHENDLIVSNEFEYIKQQNETKISNDKELENTSNYEKYLNIHNNDEEYDYNVKSPVDNNDEEYDYNVKSPVDNRVGNELFLHKDGFYYYIENNEIVITHGDKYYNFKDKNIKLPSKIKGLPVTKIGQNAFSNAIFNSMICSPSIKDISDYAFKNAKFNYLKLPSNLNSLSPLFISDDEGFIPSDDERDVFERVIQIPQSINNYIADTFKEKFGINLIARFRFKYLSKEEIANGHICFTEYAVDFDEDTNCLYILYAGKIKLLFGFNIANEEDIPIKIGQYDVAEINNKILSNILLTRYYYNEDNISNLLSRPEIVDYINKCSILYAKGLEKNYLKLLIKNERLKISMNNSYTNDSEFIKLLGDSNLKDYIYLGTNKKIVIPEHINSIKCYNDKDIILEDINLVLHEKFEYIRGISSNDPIFIPKNCVAYNNNNTIYLKKYIENVYSGDAIHYLDIINDNSGHKYAILFNKYENKKSIGLLEINPCTKEYTLPTSIDGLSVTHLLNTKINNNLNIFRMNIEHFFEKIYLSNYKINNIQWKNKVEKFVVYNDNSESMVIENILKLKPESTKIIEIEEGINDIYNYSELGYYGNDLEIYLPESIEYIADNSLKGINIVKIHKYKDSYINPDSYDEDCEIIERKTQILRTTNLNKIQINEETITDFKTQNIENTNSISNIYNSNKTQKNNFLNKNTFHFTGLTCNCIGLGFMCLHFILSLLSCGVVNEFENSSSFGFFGFIWCVLSISGSINFINNKESRKNYGVITTITTFFALISSFIGNVDSLTVFIALILFSISMGLALAKNSD